MSLWTFQRTRAVVSRVLFGLFTALGFVNSSAAESKEGAPADIGSILSPIITRAKIPGIAAVVLNGDRIIAQGVAGVRKVGSIEPITLDDRFELASCTKAMTATLMAMLIEEGKLHWETSLAEIFREEDGNIAPAWKTITVRQLLEQRTGITGNHPFDFFTSAGRTNDNLAEQRQKFAMKLLAHAPDIPPGKFAYSAVNFILAGAVLEKITGRTWADLMQERLYRRLGISSGGFGPPGAAGQVTQPWGHGHRRFYYVPIPGSSRTPFDPGSTSADYPPAAGPAGMAHMSVTDWAKFVAVYLRADPANPHRQITLLKADTFAQLYEPGETEYAAGWYIGSKPWAKGPRPGDTGRVLFHAGDNGRWSIVVWVAPEIDFAILIACNRGGMADPIDEVAGALLRFVPKSPLTK